MSLLEGTCTGSFAGRFLNWLSFKGALAHKKQSKIDPVEFLNFKALNNGRKISRNRLAKFHKKHYKAGRDSSSSSTSSSSSSSSSSSASEERHSHPHFRKSKKTLRKVKGPLNWMMEILRSISNAFMGGDSSKSGQLQLVLIWKNHCSNRFDH